MKILITLLLISTSASATTISQYISSPDGSSIQTFKVNAKSSSYVKHSNFFDKKKDFSLGHFELKSQDFSKEVAKLDEILKKVKEVDSFLKKKNQSFNDLSTKNPHESFLLLENFRITKSSDLYPELKAIYDKLSEQDWKQVSGIKLSSDYKTISTIKDGKEVSKETFNFQFHCKKAEAPTVCGYKDLGIIFVQ